MCYILPSNITTGTYPQVLSRHSVIMTAFAKSSMYGTLATDMFLLLYYIPPQLAQW